MADQNHNLPAPLPIFPALSPPKEALVDSRPGSVPTSESAQKYDHTSTPTPVPNDFNLSLQQAVAPPQSFSPFFTLIEDTTRASHHHPAVHYIFSDDEEDPVTTYVASLAESQQLTDPPSERVLVVDVSETGDKIKSVQSLSKDWQVVGVNITTAPTWMADDEASVRGEAGLMLTIEGMSQLEKVRKIEALDELAIIYTDR